MNYCLRLYFISSLLSLSSPLLAETMPEEACQYFDQNIKLELASGIPEIVLNLTTSEYRFASMALERYSYYVKDTYFETAWQNGAGKVFPGTAFSASYVCLTDTTDRRVLSIAVIDGPLVGEKATSNSVETKIISGPRNSETPVGNQIHQGKY